jgi:SAM-dependent methyltransferase
LRESLKHRGYRRVPARQREQSGEPMEATQRAASGVWRESQPNETLTWGRAITGDAFISQARAHGAFGDNHVVAEVGPGYGRLAAAALRSQIPFRTWIGVDLSAASLAHLRETYPGDRFTWVHSDAAEVVLDEKIDTLLSSLTLKHIYPSFEATLVNLAGQLSPGGVVCFDVPEATLVDRIRRRTRDFVEGDIYMRRYTRSELSEIAAQAGLDIVAFEDVHHGEGPTRLFVTARAR